MLLDLSRLRSGVERLNRRFEPDALEAVEDFRVVSPVLLTGEVRKDGPQVRLKGRLEATLECACSRCLELFEVPVTVDLDLLFLPASAVGSRSPASSPDRPDGPDRPGRNDRPDRPDRNDDDDGDGEAITEDGLGASFYKDEVLDLGDIIREQFFLALPMKPLCRQDCQGLCPVCGLNRNRESCACRVEWIDPRLEPLKHLRSES
jgi:uncharacterized protein